MSNEVKALLTGAIPSIRTPFTADGEVDFKGLGNLVDHCMQHGAKVLMLTAGDSHYLCLSDEEIARITTEVCRQARGRAHVIAADRYHATARAVAFARFAREAGALCVMTMPPDWGASTTAESLAEHYGAVGRELPVMIVTNIYNPRGHKFGIQAIELALKASPAVVSVKDDTCGDFSRLLCSHFQERLAIIAGGQKVNHLAMHPFGGGHGYLSTFASLIPAVADTYWSRFAAGDVAGARQVYERIDRPFFDIVLGMTGGFDAGMHAAMEILGICPRHRRKPYHTATVEQSQRLAEFLGTVPGLLRSIGAKG